MTYSQYAILFLWLFVLMNSLNGINSIYKKLYKQSIQYIYSIIYLWPEIKRRSDGPEKRNISEGIIAYIKVTYYTYRGFVCLSDPLTLTLPDVTHDDKRYEKCCPSYLFCSSKLFRFKISGRIYMSCV